MQLLLFSHEPAYSQAAVAAGVDRVIVDWEFSGKHRRQQGRDTQINHGTLDDLRAAVAGAPGQVICRINNSAGARDRECRLAIENGAVEIWLPMLRDAREAEQCLRRIDGDAQLGVLVETREAMLLGRELQSLPLSRAYVGLHDYRIDSGHGGLFDPLVDGTLDRFRESFRGELGFAGVTDPAGGDPVPQTLLLAAMARLDCGFGVARRCFRKEIAGPELPAAIARIHSHWQQLRSRGPAQVDADQRELAALLARLPAGVLPERACAS